MNRIFELTPTQESVLVSRVLVSLHKAVDEHFPGTLQANRQFTKTVFSDAAGESTAIDRPAAQTSSETDPNASAAIDPDQTDPGRKKAEDVVEGQKPPTSVSPPQPAPRQEAKASAGRDGKPPSYVTYLDPIQSGLDHQSTGADESQLNPFASDSRPDWGLRLTVVALVLGLAALGYLLLFT